MNEAEANPDMEKKCPQCGAPLPSGVLAGLCPACLFKQGAAGDTAVPPEAAPFQPPGVEEVARLFPQLEIIALIGKGGMGAVYQARQPTLDRIVALKILPPQTAGGPGFIERFNREARALAKLNHPNIVAVYEFGQVNGLPFFIMEFVDGLNLRQLEQAGKLSPREALQIVPQICDALQFAHDEGIVHRDIKPENILLDKKGRVKIADFGIAKILGGTPDIELTQTKGAIGTPHYMAPEQMEKPTTVDHRADIFSLGVVFYEMLTGELPLGKFAPPSSRKVEVDVRLDEVVFRALEKDPERRYQHASQVKTAVDTIAGSAAPPPAAANARVLAQEILAQDYTLNIGSCVRRGWALLRGEFWPFVGLTALLIAPLGFASSVGGASIRHGPAGDNSTEITSALAILVWGPLVGGLLFYFLKKIRREKATVETAFCGFSHRFLHLFLAGFVTSLLTWLGFLCLILPGIYLLIAWMFTLPLVMDKELDFWSAMELSRKVVTKHWFKFLGFGIVLLLLTFAGVLAFVVGVFVMMPLALAALMYAYEDIFGGTRQTAAPPPVGAGPSGTIVLPGTPPKPPHSRGGTWTPVTKIGLAAVVLVIGFVVVISLFHSIKRHRQMVWQSQQEVVARQADQAPAAEPAEPVRQIPPFGFGPVVEQELTNLTTIKLADGQTEPLPQSITGQNRGPEKDAAACAWMEQAGMDFAYLGGYDGFYGMTRDLITLKRGGWDDTSPELLAKSLHDAGQDVGEKFGDSSPLNNPTNYTYGFKTGDGRLGLLQITSFIESPPGVKIRYKLVPQTTMDETNPVTAMRRPERAVSREALDERLEAASSINDVMEKDKPLAAVATDAAKAGEVEIAKKALGQMFDQTKRDEATHDAALLLAKLGLRKQAIEMARGISDYTIRNHTLSELAEQVLTELSTEDPTAKSGAAGGIFATTHWTVVLAAGRGSSQQADVALEELCRTYWYPLYAYVRRHGHSREDSEDLTQGFFARLLEKNYLEGISSDKGRFRSFLLVALKRFLANEWDRANRQKRGGGVMPLSLDWQDADTRYQINPADDLSPDKLYDRAWALIVLERVIVRLRDESEADGKAGLYEQLKPFLMMGKSEIPYAQAAAALKLTEGAVRVAVHRLRRRYRELLREEITQTLANPAQAGEEMQALFSALAGG